MSLPVPATETAANVVAAIAPALEGHPWWAYVLATAVAVRVALPLLDWVSKQTANKWDNWLVSMLDGVVGVLTRRKK